MPRKRALIVNCYVDETRRPVARRNKIPQTLGPVFLAGGLEPDLWEIRLYNELTDGPLEDRALLGWPDLVVLTGLITSLDRMRQVSAYARTLNPSVVVAGGGHVARAMPDFCRGFLDYVCLGDVEEIRDVVTDAFGPAFAAADMTPRYDLVRFPAGISYVESSRYCNFKCSFCTLTAERRAFQPLPGADFYSQIEAACAERKLCVSVNDNNFYGSNPESFRERLACMGRARDGKLLDGWSALVTSDFFLKPENVTVARDAGCVALFSGVESFDPEWTARHDKLQNGVRPQVEIIRDCLDAGVVFLYGLMFDIGTRPIAELRKELEFILDNPEITLPAYISVPIPIPVTPYFYECLDEGRILPGTRFRDLDSTTISLQTLDPLEEASEFVRDLQSMRGYRWKVLSHAVRFAARHFTDLSTFQMVSALYNGALIAAPLLTTLPRNLEPRSGRRTHVSSTEPLDSFYQPAFRVESKFESAFEPTFLVDRAGRLNSAIAEDIENGRKALQPRRREPVVALGSAV